MTHRTSNWTPRGSKRPGNLSPQELLALNEHPLWLLEWPAAQRGTLLRLIERELSAWERVRSPQQEAWRSQRSSRPAGATAPARRDAVPAGAAGRAGRVRLRGLRQRRSEGSRSIYPRS
jgi:hypothetical protein